MSEEYFYIKDATTGLYFGGFDVPHNCNKPLWVSKDQTIYFKEMEALRLQRRLEILYLPYHKIVLEEKTV